MAGLGDYPVAGVVRAESFARAAKFYTEVLGLEQVDFGGEPPTTEGFFKAGDGTMVSVYERPGMPAPQNTALGFGVPADEFDTVIAELRARGVVLEEYDMPEIGLKTVDGIAILGEAKAAWFKDSEGNILNVGSM